jgi:hypothetical protein
MLRSVVVRSTGAAAASASARGSARRSYTTAEALTLLERHFAPAVARAPKGNNIVCKEAKGSWLTDVSGRKYLDLQTGIGVANTGHSHPKCVVGWGPRGGRAGESSGSGARRGKRGGGGTTILAH